MLPSLSARQLARLALLIRVLRSVRQGDDALYILITGFDSNFNARYALVTNRAVMNLRGRTLARRQFEISTEAFPSTRVIFLGDCLSVASADSTRLSELARDNSPPQALIGKAIEVIRSAASVSETVGQQISSIILNRDPAKPLQTAYHSKEASSAAFLPAQIGQIKGATYATKGASVNIPQSTRPAKNAPCCCGSGLKYKRCHMKQDDAAGAWTMTITDFTPS